ncbi:MAG: stage II sporulation protein M [Monoglobaceae bacterium]
MPNNLKEKLFENFCENRIKLIGISVLFMAGVITGAVIETGMNSSESFECIDDFIYSYNMRGISVTEVFLRSLLSYGRVFFLIWLSGRAVWLIPLNFIEICSRGLSMGYTVAYMVEWGGAGGFALSFLMLFFQNIIFIPMLVVYSAYRLNCSLLSRHIRSVSVRRQRQGLIGNGGLTAAAIGVIILCSCIEAYIIPAIIKPLCTNFQ